MGKTEREVFRDMLLDENTAFEPGSENREETDVLSKRERDSLTQAWNADDNPTREQIAEMENPKSDGDRLCIRGWSFPKNLKELEQKFIETYSSYTVTRDPDAVQWQKQEQEMVRLLGELCTYKIYLRIKDHHAYSWGEEERIANDCHVDVIKNLRKRKQDQECFKTGLEALRYYRTVYLHKTMDYFREWTRKAAKELSIPSEGEIQEHPEQYGPYVKHLQDSVFTKKKSGSAQAYAHGILKLYLEQLMDYNQEPSKALAVMYARVLYQTEPIVDCAGTVQAIEQKMQKHGWSLDPASKDYEKHWAKARSEVEDQPAGASPTWAYNRMGKDTVRMLEDDSEASVQRNIDPELVWGPSMRGKLNEVATKFAPACWGELVYTDCFTRKDIQAWADSVHESMKDKTAKIMSQDDACCEYVDEVLGEQHPLMQAYQIQKNKKKKRKGAGT